MIGINWKTISISGLVLAIMIFVPLFINLGTGIMNQLVTLLIYILLAQSWNLIGGYTGQINLGIAAFFGCSVMVTHFIWVTGIPIVICVLVGSLSAIILAALIGIPTLRLKGMYFAVGTLALAQALQVIMQNIFNRSITTRGDYVQSYNIDYRYYLGLVLVVIVLIAIYYIRRSKLGQALVAIRDEEQAAQVMGVNTFKYKVISLLISAFIAGLAGGLYAYFRLYFYYTGDIFGLNWTFSAVIAVIIGGGGTLLGPVLGSIFLVILGYIFSLTLGQANLIVFGFLFIIVMLFLPQGLMGGVDLIRPWLSRWGKRSANKI
ncbi:MAG: branched-chain amino acid ABC transporter permease [Dehalococcoidales bacterium]